ncbi:hypothetical protein [Duganella sp. BJB476]|uniref:hypothetical protein n=1 Tax=Duganella sp. BJB476 TaxID=1871176 RepID=UPI000E35571D|nr:hypothetical protein [Duganella sp. BJB476]RFP36159.1 hypothetical protein D0T21_06915 [Duganella sp. BJB476]
MSQDNHNTLLLVGIAVGAYMLMKRPAYGTPGYASTAPRSVPGNVGTGVAQIASGALVGFLQGISKNPNNSGTGYVQPRLPLPDNGAIQDSADSWGTDMGSNDWPNLPDDYSTSLFA